MTSKKLKYSEDDIRVLGDIAVIQINPGMFVDNETPTHLIEEMFDNSLDEVMSGNAQVIAMNIDTKNNIYSVIDNGRGIPFEKDVPITISTKLFSGAKFKDNKKAYQISCGLHGCGLVAVNALSKIYKIEIYRNKSYACFEFEDSKLKKKRIDKFTDEPPFSTKIQIIPNEKYFEHQQVNIERLRKRLSTASAEIGNGNVFILNVDDKREVFKLNIEDNFKLHCFNGDQNVTKIIRVDTNDGDEQFNALFAYSFEGSTVAKNISSVNLLPVEQGGTHVNLFYDILRSFFSVKAKKLNYHFNPNDSLVGLRSYLILRLIEPSFYGQTKAKLNNKRSDLERFISKLENKLESYFSSNPDELTFLLSKFQEYRNNIVSKKLTSTSEKRASTKLTKLRDCTSRNGELFIVEGDSAASGLIDARDPKVHAILPLSGKILNIANKKDILKNKIIQDLVWCLGTGINENFNPDNLRYEKIICAADSDPDGGHIASLISMVIAILAPGIIDAGNFYLAYSPLFAINEKNVFIPLWTEDELKKARDEKRKITRFKGLGEMTPSQLRKCFLDKTTRRIVQIKASDNMENLIKLFSDADMKRRLLNGELSF
jgi:DNA gyrase/topoisomerase IV subunit B